MSVPVRLTFADFAFCEPPAVGLAIAICGQRYDLIEHRPFTRQDGTETTVLVWSSACADCGEEFVSTSAKTRFPSTRRCPQHRRPGKRVRRATA